MNVRENDNLDRGAGVFDAEYTAASIAELEEQQERGEIEPRAYLIKKQALVRLYLKATTKPQRKRRYEDDEFPGC